MSSPQGSFIPLLIVAMVTWKISYSKKTSKSTGAAASLRSADASYNKRNSAHSSEISERLYARNMRQARPTRNSLQTNAKKMLNKSSGGHAASVARAEEREKRDRRC